MSALITVNGGSTGPKFNLATGVTLPLTAPIGRASYLWSWKSTPNGAAPTINNATTDTANTTLPSGFEGRAWVLRLVVDAGLPSEDADEVVLGVPHPDKGWIVPPYGATLNAYGGGAGWADEQYGLTRILLDIANTGFDVQEIGAAADINDTAELVRVTGAGFTVTLPPKVTITKERVLWLCYTEPGGTVTLSRGTNDTLNGGTATLPLVDTGGRGRMVLIRLSPDGNQTAAQLTTVADLASSGLIQTDGLASAAVTYAKMQQAAALSILGNPTGALAPVSAIAAAADGDVLQRVGDVLAFGPVPSTATTSAWKSRVRVLATANITLSGTQTIDGVALSAGQRVGVVGQSAAAENGVYVVSTGTWTRASDADTDAKLAGGLSFLVEDGSTYTGAFRKLNTLGPITLGVTALSFGGLGTTSIDDAAITTVKVATNAIDNTRLRQSAGLTVVGRATNSTGNVADIPVTSGSGLVLREGGGVLAFGQVGTAGLADGVVEAKLAAAISAISVNNQRITSGADPVNPQDFATKAYVDAVKQGLDIKDSVVCATTANITLSGNQTIDNIFVGNGNRVLVKNQTNAYENGIYVVASGAWARASDANTSAKVTTGMYTFVSLGIQNQNSGWVLTTFDPIVLDTTNLSFTKFSGAGQITAGAGMTKTGDTLDVVAGDSTLTVNADNIVVALNGIGNTQLRDSIALSILGRSANSVGDPGDIATSSGSAAVLREQGGVLGFGTVATAGIADDAITNPKLRNSAGFSVIGKGSSGTGDPADIVAGVDGDVLRLSGAALGFGKITSASIDGSIVPSTRTVTAGTGLTGGGALSGDITLNLGTPLSVTTGSTNVSNADDHTHALVTYNSATKVAADAATTYPTDQLSGGQGNDAAFPTGGIVTLITQRDAAVNRVMQLAASTGGGSDIPNVWLRTSHTSNGGGGWTAFQKIWHAGNDGPGSSLDADTVDGFQASNLAKTATLLNTTAPLAGGGDLSTDRTLSINANGIDNTLLRDSAALSVLGRSVNSSGDPADITTTNGSNAVLRESGGVLGFGLLGQANVSGGFVDMTNNQTGINGAKTFTGLITANGAIDRVTGNGNSIWLQQDGTGRTHWYWNTYGGTSPLFTNAGEDAASITLTANNAGAGGGFMHRSASGVGQPAGGPITWTTTLAFDSLGITYKGNTVWHAGNDGSGSGLDADTVDGIQGASLVQTSRTISTTAPLAGGGDLSANRTLSINTNGITNALLRQSVATSIVGRSANSTGDVADIQATADGQVLQRSGGVLTWAAPSAATIGDSGWKQPCHLATTANIALSGTPTIDGVTPTVGWRVLVKNQSTSSQNGIYVVAAGAWTRATDCDTTAKFGQGFCVFVRDGGSVNSYTTWVTNYQGASSIVVDTTNFSFREIGQSNSIEDRGVTYVKIQTSAGYSVIGNTSSTTGGNGAIVAGTDGHVLRRLGSNLTFGTITAAGIADAAVTQAKLDGTGAWKQDVHAATTANITLSGTQTVDGVALVAGNRCLVKDQSAPQDRGIYVVSSGTWTRASDANADAHFNSGFIVEVLGGTVNGACIFHLNIGGAAVTVGTTFLAFDPLIKTGSLVNSAVTNAKLANMAALSVKGNGTGSSAAPTDIAAGVDGVLRESGGVLAFGQIATGGIADLAVTRAKLSNGTALSVVGRGANSVGATADISTTASSDAVLRESGGVLGFGTIATGGITNSAVTYAKIQDATGVSVLGRSANTTGPLANITASADGQVLQRAGGVVSFAQVPTAAIADDAVTGAKLRNSAGVSVMGRAANSVGDPADIAASADGQVLQRTGGALTWAAINGSIIADDSIQPTVKLDGNELPVKFSVRAASTANVASLSGTTTIDGVSLGVGERVLLKDQTTGSQNGIYAVASGAWSRVDDFSVVDSGSRNPIGTLVAVREGSVNKYRIYQLTTPPTISLDSTALTFSALPDSGGPCAASMTRTSAQTISHNTLTTIDFDTSDYALGRSGEAPTVDLTNNWILINKTGYYRVSGTNGFGTAGAAGAVGATSIGLNGAETVNAAYSYPASVTPNGIATKTLFLSSGDKISLLVFQNSGGSRDTITSVAYRANVQVELIN